MQPNHLMSSWAAQSIRLLRYGVTVTNSLLTFRLSSLRQSVTPFLPLRPAPNIIHYACWRATQVPVDKCVLARVAKYL